MKKYGNVFQALDKAMKATGKDRKPRFLVARRNGAWVLVPAKKK